MTDNFCLRVSTTRVTGTSSKMIDKKFIHWNILKSNFRWHIFFKARKQSSVAAYRQLFKLVLFQHIGWSGFQFSRLFDFPCFHAAVHLAKSSYSFFIPSGAEPRDTKSPPQSPQGLVGSATYCSPYNNPTPCGILIFHCSAIKLISSPPPSH